MKPPPRSDFNRNYENLRKHLRLQGLRPKTTAAYSRAIRYVGAHFDYRINDLTEAQLTDYLHEVMEAQSASTAKHRVLPRPGSNRVRHSRARTAVAP